MFDVTIHHARSLRHDDPDWDPLEAFLPPQLCGGFMWMQAHHAESLGELHAYKHSETRRYLYLDSQGRPYEHVGSGFRRMRRTDALEQVYGLWWTLLHARDEEKSLLADLLEPMGQDDLADHVDGLEIPPSSPASPFRLLADT